MQLFSTILNINNTLTRDAFVKLVIRWNKESDYAENIIPDLSWDGTCPARFGNDTVWLAIEEYKTEQIMAIRFEKHSDDGSVWDTDYVMNFKERRMCIHLDRSYDADAIGISRRFSTPHFITLLEKGGYLSADQDLAVSRDVLFINDQNMELLADVINGKQNYQIPVIFVSKRFINRDPLDAAFLASRVKGVAHVMVLEDTEYGYALREKCGSRNEFDGAIGIYYPAGPLPHQRFLYHGAEGYDDVLMEKIVRTVIQYSNARSITPLYTWQGVNNAILRERISLSIRERLNAEQARKKAESDMMELRNSLDEEEKRIRTQAAEDARNEANKILDSFDNEMQYMQKQIEELTRANEILAAENQGMKNKLDAITEQPVLHMGDEYDFYPGEIKDLILAALSESLSGGQEKTRRHDVVKDIIRHNDYQKISEARSEEVKNLLKSYDGMTSPIRQALEKMGFTITEDGKHYKLTYYGDDRYQTIFSKTPSDFRTGKNSSRQLTRLVF